MSENERTPLTEIRVDDGNLYREEAFTDLKVASIRRLVPVKPDGSPDESRPVLYTGETQLMSQAGMVPVHCAIEAGSLEEAIQKFPEAVNLAIERMMEEVREMQRREASRIVVPGSANVPRIDLK